jgi:hypothetical protein
MTATDQTKVFFWELDLTPDQQERLEDRIKRAIRKAVRTGWDAPK